MLYPSTEVPSWVSGIGVYIILLKTLYIPHTASFGDGQIAKAITKTTVQ